MAAAMEMCVLGVDEVLAAAKRERKKANKIHPRQGDEAEEQEEEDEEVNKNYVWEGDEESEVSETWGLSEDPEDQVDQVIEKFQEGEFLHVMEGLLEMKHHALCNVSHGGLSDSGRKRLCHFLASICNGHNSSSYRSLSVNGYSQMVSERLPMELETLVATALWKKGNIEASLPENVFLKNGRIMDAPAREWGWRGRRTTRWFCWDLGRKCNRKRGYKLCPATKKGL